MGESTLRESAEHPSTFVAKTLLSHSLFDLKLDFVLPSPDAREAVSEKVPLGSESSQLIGCFDTAPVEETHQTMDERPQPDESGDGLGWSQQWLCAQKNATVRTLAC